MAYRQFRLVLHYKITKFTRTLVHELVDPLSNMAYSGVGHVVSRSFRSSSDFSNLLGTVYRKGDIIFSSDGNSIVSPVGNRITIYDLKNNKSSTLPVESRFNFTTLDLSPNGCTLVAVNEGNLNTSLRPQELLPCRVLHCVREQHKGIVWFGVRIHNLVWELFKSVSCHSAPKKPWRYCRLADDEEIETITPHYVVCWGCFLTAGEAHLISMVSRTVVHKYHFKRQVRCLKFSPDGKHFAACKENKVFVFKAPGPYSGEFNPFIMERVFHGASDETTCLDWSYDSRILAVGSKDMSIVLYSLEKLANFRTYSLSGHTDCIVGCFFERDSLDLITVSRNGQLYDTPVSKGPDDKLSYKRLGRHYLSDLHKGQKDVHLSCAAYHKDTHLLVTGFTNGAFFLHELPDVKIWNTSSGFCFVTFDKHTSGISAVQFSRNGKFVMSASLDGTVRAYDMTRYRNFRTFTSLRPVQFACLALDTSGEFVAAGGQDVFEIYLWSIKIGRLVEVLSGHEGPVVSVAFNPSLTNTSLASVSWDQTLRLWNAVESGGTHETLRLPADGLCVTYKPDGEEVAVATLDGQITFFNCKTSTQSSSIEGRNDLGSGRSETDLVTAKQSLQGKAFTSLCYTADGKCILAGGQSKNVCIYNVQEALLVKKFEITQNRSFDAVDDFINRRKMTEFGNLALVEERETDEGGNTVLRLPGVRRGDMAARAFKPEAWAAATTEGLIVYALDPGLVFDPFELELGVTPTSVRTTLQAQENSRALMMAIKLNEKELIQEVIEGIPYKDVELTVRSLPESYVERTLKHVSVALESTRHIEFYLQWVQCLLTNHGPRLRAAKVTRPGVVPVLNTLHKNLARRHDELSKMRDRTKTSNSSGLVCRGREEIFDTRWSHSLMRYSHVRLDCRRRGDQGLIPGQVQVRCDFTKYSLRFINRLGELKLKDAGPDEKREDDDDSDVLMSDNS
uniref:Small-subunit processome Utp12 domain-containing protein n=1 Tax=Timema douglasi TaxID=61478 RepID=A0A7R8VRD0_TIMDO|nr:unnamed protein product [Timema douglasi]